MLFGHDSARWVPPGCVAQSSIESVSNVSQGLHYPSLFGMIGFGSDVTGCLSPRFVCFSRNLFLRTFCNVERRDGFCQAFK